MNSRAVNLHVERTGLPGVLRWVCHLEGVPNGSHQPQDGSALASLIVDQVIDSVSVRDGDLLVRFVRPSDIDDPTKVEVTHRAVADALAERTWLHRSVSSDVHVRPR